MEHPSLGQRLGDAIAGFLDAQEDRFRSVGERLDRIQGLLATIHIVVCELRDQTASKLAGQKWFTPTEVAELLGKRPYTVREWCRLERIHARKRAIGRGESEEWEISAEEIKRFKNHGLLPITPRRPQV
jgi:hypothetical protein